MSQGEELVVLSANCQGLQDRKKRQDVINYFGQTNASIICLQDTHWTESDESIVKFMWKGECFLNGKSSNSRGVAILINSNFEYKIKSLKKDNEGNMIYLDMDIGDISLKLINLYAPNRDSPLFFEKIKDILETDGQMYTIICGDLNLVLNPDLDCDKYKHINNPKSRQKLFEILEIFDLKDTFRQLHPNLRRYTWRRKTPLRQARLDYFLISNTMHDIVTQCSINPSYRSDHSSIHIRLKLSRFQRGRGVWKLNCSLLKEKDYLDLINRIILEEKLKYALPVYNPDHLSLIPDNEIEFTIDDGNFLEMLLLRARGETIKFASIHKKLEHEYEKKLEDQIRTLENNPYSKVKDTLDNKKNDLEKIRQKSMQGFAIRSRAQWLSDGEKPTKYFFSLEKSNYTEKTIKCIELDSGEHITDQKEILNEVRKFYSILFSSQNETSNIDLESILDGSVRKLTDTESYSLEGELELQEVSLALKKMKNNKCPGIDGFPAEFFKVFWGKLKFFVLRGLNYAYRSGEMSVSMKSCIISCIPKGDKPRQFLKNWRPISLLSVLYKIASTSVANRLKKVLDELISKFQTGFLKGRFIGENTRLVYDIMRYVEKQDLPGLLMLVDFRKAFDSVSWLFLSKLLTFFNFGPSFCKWIKVFNNNIKAYVNQCGFLSDPFNIQRGCRQGDPIASYLFLLCAQVLLLMMVKNDNIKGITIDNEQYKITQFADDTTIFLDGSKDSLVAALNTLEIFGTLSGLKVNTEKTKLVWLGRKRYSRDKLETKERLAWGTTNFNLLGLHFSVELNDIPNLNYDPILKKPNKFLMLGRGET